MMEATPSCRTCWFFRMVVICLMSVHSLKRAGSTALPLDFHALAPLLLTCVNHVNIRLQSRVGRRAPSGPPSRTTQSSPPSPPPPPPQPPTPSPPPPPYSPPTTPTKKSHKFSRLSRLRRRRHARKADESDLSEGFDSDSSHGSPKGSDNSDSASEKSDEEAAFDIESDSDMNSQESRSDLEDMEDDHGDEGKSPKESKEAAKTCEEKSGPTTSEASIASNLQAMSTQMFQTKRCFRLAPTFTNVFVKPSSEPAAFSAKDQVPLVNGDAEKPNSAEQGDVSDSEESMESSKSCHNERTLQEKLEVITSEGLLASVKVFLDWLRTNPDIIIMCAQSSQSLWNRLSVLLNLLPPASKIHESGISVCSEVQNLLHGSEQTDLFTHLLLPEDAALRNLPPLKAAHRKFNFEKERPDLTVLEESIVRSCYIRSFGHFLTHLQGSVLQYNPELGIFTSIAESQQDNILHQAQAQFRMAQEEARRNRLMRDMAQLRLQLEVSQLEGTLQQPKSQSAMSPYLIPDTQALCQHLGIIRQLANSGRFIIIIPQTVIDGLDFLKKENAGARDGIRYLEAEFKKRKSVYPLPEGSWEEF
ncbi:unnamed protein product [Staurois parvus]|uniref:PIN domain-containing protein n=1 Tax=Staurois parvus TaxID=386267 RepID=A0ABN9AB14_9NEOB|nr:unnamed protein product [Staurois parvus]